MSDEGEHSFGKKNLVILSPYLLSHEEGKDKPKGVKERSDEPQRRLKSESERLKKRNKVEGNEGAGWMEWEPEEWGEDQKRGRRRKKYEGKTGEKGGIKEGRQEESTGRLKLR